MVHYVVITSKHGQNMSTLNCLVRRETWRIFCIILRFGHFFAASFNFAQKSFSQRPCYLWKKYISGKNFQFSNAQGILSKISFWTGKLYFFAAEYFDHSKLPNNLESHQKRILRQNKKYEDKFLSIRYGINTKQGQTKQRENGARGE